MAGSVEVSIVVWSRYITFAVLKRFGKWYQKGSPVSHLSPSILQRICDFSILK